MEFLKIGQTVLRITRPSIAAGGFRSKPNDRQRKWRVLEVITEVHPICPSAKPVNILHESSTDCDSRMLNAQSDRICSIDPILRSPQIALG
jgi:hypothetical protein